MTDDSDAERGALASCFPTATLLLCMFHVQQAMWRWVWDSKHGIAKDDRKPLMALFKNIANTKTTQQYHHAVEKLRDNATACTYLGFIK